MLAVLFEGLLPVFCRLPRFGMLPMLENADFSADLGWDEVERLARQALAVVRRSEKGGDPVLQEVFRPAPVLAALLQEAVLTSDPLVLIKASDTLIRSGVSKQDIVDHYIPMVARRLGDQWCEDQLGFADVSIGSFRLQGLLRKLDDTWQVPTRRSLDTALVIVPNGVQHTLGASVLAQQLRRAGANVVLNFDVSRKRLAQLIDCERPRATLISASLQEPLDKLVGLVDTARTMDDTMPVLIGGNITERLEDVRNSTKADFVGNRWQDVLPFLRERVVG